MTENWQWLFPLVLGAIFGCVVFVRQAHKEDREDQRLAEMERSQYDQKSEQSEYNTPPSSSYRSNQTGSNDSGAYKTSPKVNYKKEDGPPKA